MVEQGDEDLTTCPSTLTWPVLAPEPTSPVRPRESPPNFSVVVAAYQAECTIREALESVLSQTAPALEIVVCDDGSTDATAEVLAEFGTSIHVLRQVNAGEAAAKNAAVRAARGEFVVVLDADDVFDRRRLEALGQLAALRPDLDVLTTDAIVEADGVPVRQAYHAGWPFAVADQRAAILERNFVFGLAAVRRSRWLEVGGFDETLSRTTDWDFWQRLILSGSRVGLVAEPLARYRLNSGTLSSDRRRLLAARLQVLERAAARTDLSPRERNIAAAAIRRQCRELLVREAQDALLDGGVRARAAYAKILTGPGFPVRARLGAAVAVIAPPVAARRHARREGGTVEIGSGLRVPREPGDSGGGPSRTGGVASARTARIREQVRTALARQLRNLPPGRRLRLRLTLAAIEAHTGARGGLRVLDAGSEEGLLCLALARRHPDWMLVAADIVAEPLQRGRRWALSEGLKVHFLRCDLEQWLGDQVYDIVVALESLEEVPDDRAAVASMVAALRPGGLFVAHVPAAGWTPVLRSAERTWRREVRHGYDAQELAATLAALGLDLLSIQPTFRRTTALAQDLRDRFKRRGRKAQLAMLPLMASAVALESRGLTWGPPRGLFVVAVKR